MDAFIRNLHRDGVPEREEQQPESTKDSDGKFRDRFSEIFLNFIRINYRMPD